MLCKCAVVFSKAESVSQQVSISPVQKFLSKKLTCVPFSFLTNVEKAGQLLEKNFLFYTYI